MSNALMEKIHTEKGIRYYYKEEVDKYDTQEDPEPVKVYWTIGEVAEMLNIAASNVRFWCVELGIETGRGSGKRRKFKREHINKLKLVAAMVADGIHLWKIKETLQK